MNTDTFEIVIPLEAAHMSSAQGDPAMDTFDIRDLNSAPIVAALFDVQNPSHHLFPDLRPLDNMVISSCQFDRILWGAILLYGLM